MAATEDSWEHTVVPRLMAAGADLNLVYRVDVVTSEGFGGYLELPSDLPALEVKAISVGAVVLILDPLISRLSTALDSHKDQQVRQALEPLVNFLDRTGMAGLGLIHLNKGTSADTLSSVMGQSSLRRRRQVGPVRHQGPRGRDPSNPRGREEQPRPIRPEDIQLSHRGREGG